MTSPASRSSTRFPTIPTGEIVGSFETYERAQAAVDQLARADFPLGDVSIVGSNLKSVERVTGKMNAGRAALRGLLSGVLLGVFVGLLVLIMNPAAGLTTLVSVMLVAVGFSVLWTLIGFSLNPAKREFTSVMQILAAHFDVVVSPELAGRARQALGAQATSPPAVPGASGAAWPGGPQSGHVDHAQRGAAAQFGQPEPSGTQPGDAADPAPGDRPEADAEPAQPPRTYGEAQDALRRERAARRDGDAKV